MQIALDDPRVIALQGGNCLWWDTLENKNILATTIYLPQGCPDWGEKKGKRNNLCTFCMLPNAVIGYREDFYGGKSVPPTDQEDMFKIVFQLSVPPEKNIHTLMVFNAGSFLAKAANPLELQETIMQAIAAHPTIKRAVIESRANFITDENLKRLTDILKPAGKKLTIRVGIETQDDYLRLQVLKKGHSRKQLFQAAELMRKYDVTSGGYVLLNPAPGLRPLWAIEESIKTLDWILGNGSDQLGMDEAYFCSTNVGPGTPLTLAWQQRTFRPASLWMVLKVLQHACAFHDRKVHLLPFKDEPELMAVPSNHVPEGIPENLDGAVGCDLAFHEILDRYRQTRNPDFLVPPECSCRPDWF